MLSVIPLITLNITLHGTAYVLVEGVQQSINENSAYVLQHYDVVKLVE